MSFFLGTLNVEEEKTFSAFQREFSKTLKVVKRCLKHVKENPGSYILHLAN